MSKINLAYKSGSRLAVEPLLLCPRLSFHQVKGHCPLHLAAIFPHLLPQILLLSPTDALAGTWGTTPSPEAEGVERRSQQSGLPGKRLGRAFVCPAYVVTAHLL